MIKALFFDIDGTLVSFNTHQIPASAVDAIAKAKAKGVQIYISTGRPPLLITNIGDIQDMVDGYISTNGAYNYIGGETVSVRSIPAADVETMVRIGEENKFCYILVAKDEIAVFNPEKDYDWYFTRMLGIKVIKEGLSPWEFMQQDILQMTPFLNDAQEASIMRSLTGCISARWTHAFTDITVRGADKGRGLEDIARRHGFAISETMAFGDGGNDLSIVKAAGIGVAMGNANTALKNSSDFVTTTVDNDGVALALRRFHVIP